MNYIKVDAKFFFHVFIGFIFTTLIVTGFLVYQVNRVSEDHGIFGKKVKYLSLDGKLWSHDPDVMEALMRARARRSLGHGHVNLTQITFNDSCFGFVWSKFNILNIIKYQVEVMSIEEPKLPPLVEVIGGTSSEYNICGLNVATPYMVNLTAFGQNTDSKETSVEVMWTTHQVPPTPGDLVLMSVSETTMTLHLPEVTLKHGPLSAVEIRLNPKRSVPDPEEDSSPWSRVISRSKRSSVEPCQNLLFRSKRNSVEQCRNKLFVPTVEFPYKMLVKFYNHMTKLDQTINAGLSKSNPGKFTSMEKLFRLMEKKDQISVNADQHLTEAAEQAAESKSNESKTKDDASDKSIFIEEGEKKANREISNANLGNRSLEEWVRAARQSMKETFSNRDDSPTLGFFADKQITREFVTSVTIDQGEKKELYNDVMKVLGEWLEPDTLSTAIAPNNSLNLSKIPPVYLDFGLDPHFETIYTLSRPEIVHKLLTPASDLEDMWILVNLVNDINTILNMEESSKDKGKESQIISKQGDNFYRTTSDKLKPNSNIPAPALEKVRPSVPNYSAGHVLNTTLASVRLEPVDVIAPRGARKTVRVKRSLKWKWPAASWQKEADDGLDIDPYQTITVVSKNGSQPTLVKTGFGFLITDHYGVRHPYFNNTKLGQNLLRYNRYQEIKDFVYYGQSLLSNLTNMTEDILEELRLRIDKIMETNRKRKTKLYLDMFEDFLSLDRAKRQSPTNIPDPGRLGLPPGYQVAHFTDGMPKNITLGNHVEYGGIPNPPLEPSTEYEVVLSVLSSVADVTKHSWISINVTTAARVHKIFSPIFVILSGAFMATCLFICLLGCFVLWCSKSKRKLPFDDDQFDDLRLQLPKDFLTKSPSNMQGDAGLIYRGAQPSAYSSNMYQMQPPPPPPPQYPMFPYPMYQPSPPPFLIPPFLPQNNELPTKTEHKVNTVEKQDGPKPEEEEEESSDYEGDVNIETTDNSVDEDMTLPNYLRQSHKPESHWNRIYDVSSKRYLVDKRENLMDHDGLIPAAQNYLRDKDDDMKGLTFRDEYLSLTEGRQNVSTNALILGSDVNRFPHIHLCEHSRVVLKPDTDSGNTVIHANFINGYHIGYIASMSPFNDATVLAFWKMIYQQNIEIIVMMTNVVESDIIKCAEYWPPCSETVSTLGNFLLQTVKQMIYSDFTIRTIKLKMNTEMTCREITQFQYTAWPPRGFPSTPIPLLDMRYKIRCCHHGKCSPILVHCGTGISRTSIFIAADILIDEYEENGGVSVYTCINNMRRDRSMMVRTLDQYVFIYKIIQEDFEAGDTNCDLDEGLQNTIINLGQLNPKTGRSYIEDQFEILNFFTLDFLCDDLSIARQFDHREYKVKINRAKNLSAEKIITDEFLGLHPVFIDGYRRKNQFVLINSPTTDDGINMFWKFICKHNIITIVQLGQEEKPGPAEGVRDKKGRFKHKSQHSKPRYMQLKKYPEHKHSKYFTETTSINRFGDIFMRDIQLEELKSGGKKLRHIRHFSTPFHHLVCDFSRKRNINLNKGRRKHSRNKHNKRKSEKGNNVAISSSSEVDISSNKKFVDSELEINKTWHPLGQQQEVYDAKHFTRQQQVIYKTQQVPWQQQKTERKRFLHERQLQDGKDFDPNNFELESRFNNLCETWDYKQQEKQSNKPCVCMYNGRTYQIDNSYGIGTERHLNPYVQNKSPYQVVERHGLHINEYPLETSNIDAPSVSTDSIISDNKFYYVLKDGSLVKSQHYNRRQQRSKLSNGSESCFPSRHKTHMNNAKRKYYKKHYNIMQRDHGRKETYIKCRDSNKKAGREDTIRNSFVAPKNYLQHESKEQSFHFLPSKRQMIEKLRNVQRTIMCSTRVARHHIKAQPPRFLRVRKHLSNYRSALLSKLSTSRLDQSNSAVGPELISQSFVDPSLTPSLAKLNKTRWLPIQLHTHKYSHLRGIVNTQESMGSMNLVKHQEFSKDWISVSDSAQLQCVPISKTRQDCGKYPKTFYPESYTSSSGSSMIKNNQTFQRISQGQLSDSERLSKKAKSSFCDKKDKLTLKMINNTQHIHSDSQKSLRSHIEFGPHRKRVSNKRTLKQCKKTKHLVAVTHEMDEDVYESTMKLTGTSKKTVEQICQENRNQSSVSPKRKGFKKSKKSMFASPDRCKMALTSGQLLDLLELIWEWQSTPFQVYGQNKATPAPMHRPILIHCAEGTDDANLMCACALVCERAQEEQEVDIYHILKHFRKKCPKAIESFAEYEFIYRVLCHYVSEYMDDVALSNRWTFRGHINKTYQSVIDDAVPSLVQELEIAYSDNTGNKANSHQSELDPVTVDELSLLNDSDVSVKRLTLANKTISKSISPEAIQHNVRSFLHKSLVNETSSAMHRDCTNSDGIASSSSDGTNANQSRDKFGAKMYDEKLIEKMTCQKSITDRINKSFDAPLNRDLKSMSFNQGFMVNQSSVEIEHTKVIHIHSPTGLLGIDLPSEVQHNRKAAYVDLVMTDIADSDDHDILCSAGKSSTNIIQGMEQFSYQLMDSNI